MRIPRYMSNSPGNKYISKMDKRIKIMPINKESFIIIAMILKKQQAITHLKPQHRQRFQESHW